VHDPQKRPVKQDKKQSLN